MDQATLNWLKQHGTTIGFKAAEGDLLSRRIVRLYTMYQAWQSDKVALALLEASIDEYKRRVEKGMRNNNGQ